MILPVAVRPALWALVLAGLSGIWPVRLSAAPAAASPAPDGDAIYAYTDERGRLVHVQRLSDIPQALRASAQRVDQPDEAPAAESGLGGIFDWLGEKSGVVSPRSEPIVYRYVAPGGRTVFTNLAASVPADQRAFARVDLRHVPLNSLLARDLDQDLARRYQQLKASGTCERMREVAESPWWQRVWLEQRPLVVSAGVLLLLLLMTPWMASKGWGAPWARVLWTALPMLGFMALSGVILRQSGKSVAHLQGQLTRCEPGAWEAAAGLPQRFQMVQALEAEKQALAQIERESR